MNPVIKPAYHLMNRLSYRNKFVLIASLFAIPLVLFAGRLAFTFHTEAQQAKLTQEGLIYLHEATRLIENLEELRDASVINFAHSNPELATRLAALRELATTQIVQLKNKPALTKHRGFLSSLEYDVAHHKISPGNEAARIRNIFENANVLVEQAYLWRLKLSYDLVSRANTDPKVISILDIMNGSYPYFIALGEARAFGSYYLQQGYISASGIQILDSNYQSLTRLINSTDVDTAERKALFADHPNSQSVEIKELLTNARSLIDEQLIQTLSLDSDPHEFFRTMTHIIQTFYGDNEQLLELSNKRSQLNYEKSVRQLVIFYTSATLMLLLLTYLYIGFFNYIRITIQDLVRSARRVAQGDYEQAIKISAKDELIELADAMDKMRQSIKVREDELTRIGHTDGLTQLYNRQYFDQALAITLASSSRNNTPVALVMMDIDHFKSINDQYGHQTGDDCLMQVARLFKEQFQRKTDIVARYGGEEFIAILYGTTFDEATEQTEALRQRIAKHALQTGKLSLSITASFGIASLSPPDSACEADFLSLVDTMLYQAKHKGRNCVCSARYQRSANLLNASG